LMVLKKRFVKERVLKKTFWKRDFFERKLCERDVFWCPYGKENEGGRLCIPPGHAVSCEQ